MPAKIFDNTIAILSNALDLRAEKQRLLSSNIANQETPGYKAKDIDFASELRRRGEAGPSPSSSIGTTNPGHIPISTRRPAAPRILTKADEAVGYDKNTVGVDAEMVKLAENSLMYNVASKMLRSKFNILMTAIKEGGR